MLDLPFQDLVGKCLQGPETSLTRSGGRVAYSLNPGINTA